ncbi:alpha/beta fold hydrolase [Pelagicoccus sp. SDUM812005]|uniref:alpha/beta fold hydrolase n=1 Tax=Pelagicoccus sp. SDUM812005 TaxID=3041257 RepID=UPI00280C8D57|nr:alpha/beta fold hydrolase [Pelagicoccus sp. SDUM812005]MDQ8183445.1 alpha/beta fold hydrolase [Pelagicoccus sp. SDUM812005]
MKHLLFRTTVFFLAFSIAARTLATDSERETFVIVHGATAGGWEWKSTGDYLKKEGHEVYRATLTGLGERYHLANPEIDLDTHIDDVVNLILFEDLHDVVLSGHSYGGMVITGVINEIPERIKHVIFLDAAVPNDGESIWDMFGSGGPRDDSRIENGMLLTPWVTEKTTPPHNTPQSIKTFSQAVSYDNPAAKALDVTFVAFIPEEQSVEERSQSKTWRRAVERGWTIRTFPGGHVAQQEDPSGVATLMYECIGDVNTDR